MSETYSNMLDLGSPLPSFSLPNTATQEIITSIDYASGRPLLVAFICNHCPFVVHIIKPLAKMMNEYQAKGIRCLAISSNDVVTHPLDAPELMVELARTHQFQFPYCYDETQAVARSFQAACTPDFYLFNATEELVYRGCFDKSTPGNDIPVTGEELRCALEAVLDGRTAPLDQSPSLGCNIKWKE